MEETVGQQAPANPRLLHCLLDTHIGSSTALAVVFVVVVANVGAIVVVRVVGCIVIVVNVGAIVVVVVVVVFTTGVGGTVVGAIVVGIVSVSSQHARLRPPEVGGQQ